MMISSRRLSFVFAAAVLLALTSITTISAFVLPSSSLLFSSKLHARSPSRVVDEDGPTPDIESSPVETVDLDELPEMDYHAYEHPVPHQPWRRGTTEGCHEPIEAEWRQQAEEIMHKAARMVGGTILDITWFLTRVELTIDPSTLEHVDEYETGPEIVVQAPGPNGEGVDPEYFDPEDPNPEPIWDDEEEFLFERDVETEEQARESMYARLDDKEESEETDEELKQAEQEVSLYVDRETRADMAAMTEEEEARLENVERAVDSEEVFEINTLALSTLVQSVLEALETVEDDLRILERHEVVLTEPGLPYLLESQQQFDANRGKNVEVETLDPFGSNRVLKGKLLDRNAMDVYINQKGRMVTIPLNFVKCVKLPHLIEYEEDDEEYDEEEGDWEEEELAP